MLSISSHVYSLRDIDEIFGMISCYLLVKEFHITGFVVTLPMKYQHPMQ